MACTGASVSVLAVPIVALLIARDCGVAAGDLFLIEYPEEADSNDATNQNDDNSNDESVPIEETMHGRSEEELWLV